MAKSKIKKQYGRYKRCESSKAQKDTQASREVVPTSREANRRGGTPTSVVVFYHVGHGHSEG